MDKVEQLEQELEVLRKAVAPGERKELTDQLREALTTVGVLGEKRTIRGKEHVYFIPKEAFKMFFGRDANVGDLTAIGRSFAALGFHRYASSGVRMYVMELADFRRIFGW